ncbi:unnamed protein product, partial [Phaeothamnion confervicola]
MDLFCRYIVTDVAQGTLDFVATHPALQRFVKMGVLDVALLDGESPETGPLWLQISKRHVDLATVTSPVVAICNYVFDTLVQDAFRIKGGQLYENRVSMTSERLPPADVRQLHLKSMEGLSVSWNH